MRGIIYKYTNKINGKIYIGQTTNEENRRRKWNNPNNKYGGAKINNARKKYGIDNWLYEVIFVVDDSNVEKVTLILNQMEEYYINLYDSHNKRI